MAFRDKPIRGNFLDDGHLRPLSGSGPWGDVWEWTQSPFMPYPGFRPPEGAVGQYNGKFMVNQFVLRDESCATPTGQMRPTYRTFSIRTSAGRCSVCGWRRAADVDTPVIRNRLLLKEALTGLRARPKVLHPNSFYDSAGSALFEKITELPEYYPSRAEVSVFRDQTKVLARHIAGGAVLVQLGSGASTKTRILLDAVEGIEAYVPVDISEEFLQAVAADIDRDYPSLEVAPLAGDLLDDLKLPGTVARRPKVCFFPGSTLENLEPPEALALLRRVRNWPKISAFLLGIDLVNNPEILLRAYGESQACRRNSTATF